MITSDAQIKNIDVSNLKGVGPKISSSLNRLKIFSLFDLIFHFPFRYQDRTYISKVSDLTTDSGSVLLCLKETLPVYSIIHLVHIPLGDTVLYHNI